MDSGASLLPQNPSLLAQCQVPVSPDSLAADQKLILLRSDRAHTLLNARRSSGTRKDDLVDDMLYGVDPKTGLRLDDDTIVDNLITFLAAGLDTTAGMLACSLYYLIKDKRAMSKARAEVDAVVGKSAIQAQDLTRLPYLTAILRETLRLCPSVPGMTVTPNADVEVLAGKYTIKRGQQLVLMFGPLQRDPAAYGDDADEFRPERMLDENFNKLPQHAFKPFGNGSRACLGRAFAWQEALLTLAMLLQTFDFTLADPTYELQIISDLTLKPKDFNIKASLRDGLTATQLQQRLLIRSDEGIKVMDNIHKSQDEKHDSAQGQVGKPMTIYYGSNSGTCQAFAHSLGAEAAAHGYFATNIEPLDSASGKLSTSQPVIIITASYEGQPCQNGGQFQTWLEGLVDQDLSNVTYAVFGAGHSDWRETFHRVPRSIDSMLAKHGAERLCSLGLSNAAQGDMFLDFETWTKNILWPELGRLHVSGITTPDLQSEQSIGGLKLKLSSTRSDRLCADVVDTTVLVSNTLTTSGTPIKKHLEVMLPEGMSYQCGDYLSVLPHNPADVVTRALKRFRLSRDTSMIITNGSATMLPVNTPISAQCIFDSYVELSQPATRRNIEMLQGICSNATTTASLLKLSGELYAKEIFGKRVSLLDLLERQLDLDLPLASYLAALPPMRTRSYSISSSPLVSPSSACLTYTVIQQSHVSGHGEFTGSASNYLSALTAGDSIQVAVKCPPQAFRLPSQPEQTPIIMICAGSGVAPFRGFVQERAAQLLAGISLAPAMLIMGSRQPDIDDLYREEFDAWEAAGAVHVYRAFSRRMSASSSAGCKYAQDVLLAERDRAWDLWKQGAKVYVCGSAELAEGVKCAWMEIYKAKRRGEGCECDEAQVQAWYDQVRNQRYVTEVFT